LLPLLTPESARPVEAALLEPAALALELAPEFPTAGAAAMPVEAALALELAPEFPTAGAAAMVAMSEVAAKKEDVVEVTVEALEAVTVEALEPFFNLHSIFIYSIIATDFVSFVSQFL